MRRNALMSLGCLLAGGLAASGQDLRWQVAPDRPAARLGTPTTAAALGKPRGIATRTVRGQADDTPAIAVPEPGYPRPVATNYPPGYYAAQPYPYYAPPPGYYPPPAYVPPPGYQPAPSYYPPAPAPAPVSNDYAYSGGSKLPGDPVRRTSFSSRSASSTSFKNFGESVQDWCGGVADWCTDEGRRTFESDHAFDGCFASPVTNPFLFEDPRSLTEVRPIFMWLNIPSSNWYYQGGSAFFYGLQARLAFTERFSVTLNKLGGVTINPDAASGQPDASGFAEMWLGPKYTFIRNPDSGTAVAGGLIFQIPTGPGKVAQDTGDFGMVPYLSLAQNFGRSSYGKFNFMDTLGYNFGVGTGRSDFFYNSAHLDFDVANLHKIYPFLELNWFHYTSSGNTRPVDFEGRDFANIGASNIGGRDFVTLAPGFRYKFTEAIQLGLATEFTVTNPEDMEDFRLVLDMIFRY